MRALVTDGDQRPALAITRSLARRGVSVVVGEERRASLASASRHCERHVTYPSPHRHPEAFRDFLLGLVELEQIDLVVPVTDVTTHAVSLHARAIGRHAAAVVPPLRAFELVSDKVGLLARAAACGIPTPRAHVVDGAEGLEAVVDRVRYPAVVKPARSRLATGAGWISTSVHYAAAEAELRRLYRDVDYLAAHPSLVQERIVGPGVGLFTLFDRGRLVAAFAHRRLREKPPSGGVSVLRESVPLDPALAEHATRLLGPLGWHGVAMLEYKRDARTGVPFLMEVNGRFWGSLQLAIDAGVDFPYLLYRLAHGCRIETPAYAVGVRSRWLLGDLDHLLLRMFKSRRALQLPDGAPSRLRVLADFLERGAPGLRYEVLDRDDPGPFRHELRAYVGAIGRRATDRARDGIARAAAAAIAGAAWRPAVETAPRER
jgi:predicted ATP-grasp superfamily ATP-dependent carboligase